MKFTNPDRDKNVNRSATELATLAFALIDKYEEVDTAIDRMLEHVAQMLSIDSLEVHEFVEEGEALKCTYEWNMHGGTAQLGIEKRFVDKQRVIMLDLYANNPDGVYVFQYGGEPLTASSPARPGDIKTLLQVPMHNAASLTGLINFINYDTQRAWTDEEIATAHTACRVLSSYMFGMRKVDETRESLRNLIRCDQVTGLLHYDEFLQTVKDSFNPNSEARLAICSIDLSNFKYVNERYGFPEGDEILKFLAKTFYRYFDRTIACCREYSDNFVMSVRIHADESDESLTERFRKFGEAFTLGSQDIVPDSNIIINIGLAVLDFADDNVEDGVANANAARKYARDITSDGQVRIALFTDEMVKAKRREIELVSQLKNALDDNEFTVYYQPKVRCVDKSICGAEALVRWIKRDGTVIYPDEFIGAFEKDGCIVKVDYCVYDKVFSYLRWRLDKGLKCVRISMNVSRVHLFGRAFASYIKFLLDKYRIPPELVEFEITESVYIDDLPALEYTVETLRSRGIRVSIDDFGSGYSSLDILTEIPVDIIKLDRVFMKDTLAPSDKIIISTIIEMSRKLGLEVVCEGVENEGQLEFLREACCDVIQGYYFSKPVEEGIFNKMLEKGSTL